MRVIDKTERLSAPIAATIGMFDGVHAGHRFLLSNLVSTAKSEGLRSAVITFDRHPSSIIAPGKEKPMLMTYDDKIKALESTGIDYTIILPFDKALSELTADNFLDYIHSQYSVRLLLMGYDHRFGHDASTLNFDDYIRLGEKNGIEIRKCGILSASDCDTKIASSTIRNLIGEGDVSRAATLMSDFYSLTGTVVEGFHNGKKIGFPTANIHIDDPKLAIPRQGVYAVIVELPDKKRYRAMLDIGNRPTFDNGNNISIEANIFDFSADIYGERLTVYFIERLRDECKMRSIEELKSQLHEDKKNAELILSNLDTLI